MERLEALRSFSGNVENIAFIMCKYVENWLKKLQKRPTKKKKKKTSTVEKILHKFTVLRTVGEHRQKNKTQLKLFISDAGIFC